MTHFPLNKNKEKQPIKEEVDSLPAREKHYWAACETKAGWIGLLGSDLGLAVVTLPQKTREMAILGLGNPAAKDEQSEDHFQHLTRELTHYFEGKKVVFNEKMDFSRATIFEQSVWQMTCRIGYGQTQSYGWVAQQINNSRASRAVGQALARNPLPIIVPCHRVIAGNGELRGFGGGLEMKQYLLDLEAEKRN
jgi:methylated-DNA-[protein]-cysteine S-methyltransferase